MKIMQKIGLVGLFGLLLAGAGSRLAAQEHKGWQVGAALPMATTELKQWTNQSLMGLCVDGSYLLPIKESKAYFRFGLGLNYFPGKEGNGVPDYILPVTKTQALRTINLTNISASVDVYFPIGSTPVSLFTGLSLNTWFKNVSGQHIYDPSEEDNVSGMVDNIFGKYGFRLGAEYALSDRLSVALTFQLTELGTDYEFVGSKFLEEWYNDGNYETKKPLVGKHSVTPSWLQIGVRYRF